MEKKLIITQVRSGIGRPRKQRAVLRGLGITKLYQKVCLPDSPEIRGMVAKVNHLIKVEEVEG